MIVCLFIITFYYDVNIIWKLIRAYGFTFINPKKADVLTTPKAIIQSISFVIIHIEIVYADSPNPRIDNVNADLFLILAWCSAAFVLIVLIMSFII